MAFTRWNTSFCTAPDQPRASGFTKKSRAHSMFNHAIALRSKRTPPKYADAGTFGKADALSPTNNGRSNV